MAERRQRACVGGGTSRGGGGGRGLPYWDYWGYWGRCTHCRSWHIRSERAAYEAHSQPGAVASEDPARSFPTRVKSGCAAPPGAYDFPASLGIPPGPYCVGLGHISPPHPQPEPRTRRRTPDTRRHTWHVAVRRHALARRGHSQRPPRHAYRSSHLQQQGAWGQWRRAGEEGGSESHARALQSMK